MQGGKIARKIAAQGSILYDGIYCAIRHYWRRCVKNSKIGRGLVFEAGLIMVSSNLRTWVVM